MSDQDFFEEDVQEDQQPKDPVRAQLRKVEAENKRLRQIEAEALEAKRELAFVKAGVDLSSPMAKYFVKGYDGDLDVQAIQQAAAEANLTKPMAQQEAPTQQEQQAWGRISNAAKVGDSSEPVVDYAMKIANARTESEVLELLSQAKANQRNIL